jgi:hypothetical protein
MHDDLPLFDGVESRHRKDEGMRIAAEHRPTDLEYARQIARRIAVEHPDRECDADRVGRILQHEGIDLGPASGSLFKGSEWIFTGRRILSKRKANHARELKVWRLR